MMEALTREAREVWRDAHAGIAPEWAIERLPLDDRSFAYARNARISAARAVVWACFAVALSLFALAFATLNVLGVFG